MNATPQERINLELIDLIKEEKNTVKSLQTHVQDQALMSHNQKVTLEQELADLKSKIESQESSLKVAALFNKERDQLKEHQLAVVHKLNSVLQYKHKPDVFQELEILRTYIQVNIMQPLFNEGEKENGN